MGNEITKCNQTRVKRQPRVQKHRQVGGKPASKPTVSNKPLAPKPSPKLSKKPHTPKLPKVSKKPPDPKLMPKPKPPPYPPPTKSPTSPSPEEISSTYEILD